MPCMEHYYQPEIECASREQIRAWQNERLIPTVKRVYENVPYYRRLMEEKALRPTISVLSTICTNCPSYPKRICA